ncbi:MAG TPA: radical SAM protein [Polyangia bacterium]|jgi:radical SAM protein with 4Fe4S-binding SPASM domain
MGGPSGGNGQAAAAEAGVPRIARAFLPAAAILELTYRCDLECELCACPWTAPDGSYEHRTELTLAHWKEVVFRLLKLGIRDVAFSGGEPLLKEGFEDLLAYAAELTAEHVETDRGDLAIRKAPPRLFVMSNGTRLRPDVLDLMRRTGARLTLNLPGLRTYREHTGSGSAETILDALRSAKARGVPTAVAVTVTRRNLGELYETIAEALLAGADGLVLNRFLAAGRGLAHADLGLTRAEAGRMLDVAEEALAAADRPGVLGTALPRCVLERAHPHLSASPRCAAGAAFFVVDPSGLLRVCPHSAVRLGSIRALAAVREHPQWRRFTMKQILPGSCGDCEMALDCDGGCRAAAALAGGRDDAPDPLVD